MLAAVIPHKNYDLVEFSCRLCLDPRIYEVYPIYPICVIMVDLMNEITIQ